MIKQNVTRTVLAAAVGGVLALAGTAHAQSVKKFYEGKDITMFIGSGAGGGYDAYARVLARHYTNHIPGNPSIVAKNMPGASGLKATNYIYNVAPHDGTAILATFNTVVFQPLYGLAKAKFDPRKLGWIGSIGKQTSTCATWHTSPVKTLEEAKKQQILVGATGANATVTIFPKLLNKYIGTKFKIVTGYSTKGLRLALERGEIQGICGLAWETHMAATPSWVLDHKLNFLAQLVLEKSPHLPNVPLAINMIKNPKEKQVWEMLVIPDEFGRPFVAPPGLPADRLAALRKAFMETLKDPAYIKDAKKTKQFIDPLTGEQIEDLIKRGYTYPKDIVARAAVYAVGKKKK